LKKLAVVAFGPLALMGTEIAPVQAHASVVRSEPPRNADLEESPERVTAWFSELLQPDSSTISVFNREGQQVDNDDSYVLDDDPQAMTVTLPPLAEGMYTVVWRTLYGTDGHTMRGSFVFFVGEPEPDLIPATEATPSFQSPADPVVRWLVLVTAMALTSGLAFAALVLGPSLLSAGP
jgi:methionine-rich copper-binding protein CopC